MHISKTIKTLTQDLTRETARPTKRRLEQEELKRWAKFFRFDPCKDPVLMKLLRGAAEFARDLCHRYEHPRWLTLVGKSGTGKTHLARGIWRAWNGKAMWYESHGCQLVREGQYHRFAKMVNDMRAGGYGIFQSCAECDFLTLDDLGTEYASEFSQRQLTGMLDQREHKWTVLTSNLTLDDIAKIDTRIVDRMMRGENEVIEVDTLSYSLRS